jgi:hypothetical protein
MTFWHNQLYSHNNLISTKADCYYRFTTKYPNNHHKLPYSIRKDLVIASNSPTIQLLLVLAGQGKSGTPQCRYGHAIPLNYSGCRKSPVRNSTIKQDIQCIIPLPGPQYNQGHKTF